MKKIIYFIEDCFHCPENNHFPEFYCELKQQPINTDDFGQNEKFPDFCPFIYKHEVVHPE